MPCRRRFLIERWFAPEQFVGVGVDVPIDFLYGSAATFVSEAATLLVPIALHFFDEQRFHAIDFAVVEPDVGYDVALIPVLRFVGAAIFLFVCQSADTLRF